MDVLRVTDVNRIVENACNEQFKSFLRGNKVKFDTICLGGSIMASMSGLVDPNVMSFVTGATAANLGATVIKAMSDTMKFGRQYRMQLLSKTKEFQDCKKSYENYISKIGDFMIDLGVKDTLDIGMLYMEMLYGGYISVPGQFQYHKFKTDYDMCSPLMGARVTSGGAVCRHIASNLIDIYRYLGYSALYLGVNGTDGSLINMVKDRVLPVRSDHAVVLVGDRYGKYIIDPTWETIAEIRGDEQFAHIVYNRGSNSMYHINIDRTIDLGKTYDYDDYVKLRMMRPVHFRKAEIKQSREYAKSFISINRYMFENLRYRLRMDASNVAQLEQILSGYSDRVQIQDKKRQSKRR